MPVRAISTRQWIVAYIMLGVIESCNQRRYNRAWASNVLLRYWSIAVYAKQGYSISLPCSLSPPLCLCPCLRCTIIDHRKHASKHADSRADRQTARQTVQPRTTVH